MKTVKLHSPATFLQWEDEAFPESVELDLTPMTDEEWVKVQAFMDSDVTDEEMNRYFRDE